jgi:hypothetical protein
MMEFVMDVEEIIRESNRFAELSAHASLLEMTREDFELNSLNERRSEILAEMAIGMDRSADGRLLILMR